MRRGIITSSLLLLIGGIVYLVGWSSFLTVSSVEINTTDPKNVALIEGELLSAGLVIEAGEPLARINTRAIERTLKNQPWIGEVRIDRNWLGGEVSLFVRERIPRFRVSQTLRPSDPNIALRGEQFMTGDGTVFDLPGDLANQYRDLPEIQLQGNTSESRKDAVTLFDGVDALFPIERIVVTSIETFITENRILEEGSQSRERQVRISWGDVMELEAKITVTDQLLRLKANRNIARIDVSNPRLPIVSQR